MQKYSSVFDCLKLFEILAAPIDGPKREVSAFLLPVACGSIK